MNGPSDLPDPCVRTGRRLRRCTGILRHAVDILMVLRGSGHGRPRRVPRGTSRGAISASDELIGTGSRCRAPSPGRPDGARAFIGDPRHPNLQPACRAAVACALDTLDQCFVTVPRIRRRWPTPGRGVRLRDRRTHRRTPPTSAARSISRLLRDRARGRRKTTAWLDGRGRAALGGKQSAPTAAFALLVPAATGVPLQIDLAALTATRTATSCRTPCRTSARARGGT